MICKQKKKFIKDGKEIEKMFTEKTKAQMKQEHTVAGFNGFK